MRTIFDQILEQYSEDIFQAVNKIDREVLSNIVDVLYDTRENDKNIFIIGNGGSAAIASHMMCDFNKGTLLNAGENEGKRIRAIALTDNIPYMTALSNDLSYNEIFLEQLKTLARSGDVLLAISGSGNSPNVVKAIEYAREHNIVTVGLYGFHKGGKCSEITDYPLTIQSKHYGPIEDIHSMLGHVLTCMIRTRILEEDGIESGANTATPFNFCPLAGYEREVSGIKDDTATLRTEVNRQFDKAA